MIEFWDLQTAEFQQKSLKFESKFDTDLFQLVEDETSPVSARVSPNQELLAVSAKNKKIYLFFLQTGKLMHTISMNS
jgi:hypothetical protein